jgi:hypothetical protein
MKIGAFIVAFLVAGTIATVVAKNLFSSDPSAAGQPVDPNVFASGPAAGAKVPGPFEVFHINGEDAGKDACLYCKYGDAPVVMVFATKASDTLNRFIQRLDQAATSAGGKDVGACVVFTGDNDDVKASLPQVADKEKLKKVILAMDPRGLGKYKLNPDAEVTVLLYNKHTVKVNHAYKAGELNEKTAQEAGEEAARFLAAN